MNVTSSSVVSDLAGRGTLPEAAEQERVAALYRTRLLDTDPDEMFDRHVRLAAAMTDMPIAFFSLVDRDRQWFKAKLGIDRRETPRAWSFCRHVIGSGRSLVVPDAERDPAFAGNPLVEGARSIRFYAGAPVTVEGRHTIGTLCAVDTDPRRLADRKLAALEDLARILAREIEVHHLSPSAAMQAEAERRAAIEIKHQMRNNFAKVNALVAMTEREGLSAAVFAETTRRRLIALARASELGLEYGFGPIPASALFEAVLSAGARLPRLEGEPVGVSYAAASILGPLVDELAHDARRRREGGDATLAWRCEDALFRLEWSEAAGGDAGLPAFTSAYLTDCAPAALRGMYLVSETEGRLLYRLDLPAASVLDARV